jgi:hypothetical protein
MQKIHYLFFLAAVFLLISCSKGSVINDPQFGKVILINRTNAVLSAIEGEGNSFPVTDNTSRNVVAGKRRFRFYDEQTLLADTNLSVEPFSDHRYVVFRSTEGADLKIYDTSLNGLNKETSPGPGSVKMSFANFNKSLPDRVDILLTTTTTTLGGSKDIQAGFIQGVSQSFSAFQKVDLGIADVSGNPVRVFTLSIRDTETAKVLLSTSLSLPAIPGQSQLESSVYIIYLNATGTAGILMSK